MKYTLRLEFSATIYWLYGILKVGRVGGYLLLMVLYKVNERMNFQKCQDKVLAEILEAMNRLKESLASIHSRTYLAFWEEETLKAGDWNVGEKWSSEMYTACLSNGLEAALLPKALGNKYLSENVLVSVLQSLKFFCGLQLKWSLWPSWVSEDRGWQRGT